MDDKDIQITALKKLVLDLTDGDFRGLQDIQRQTGFSLTKCADMLRQIDDIQIQASRGKL
jgi:hypothetical protein